MGLEDLRRWQWAGIGLIAGLTFGAVQIWTGPNLDSNVVRRLNSPVEFERGLVQQPNTAGKINDIVVHPVNSDGQVWMTFRQLRYTSQRMDPKDPKSPLKALNDSVRFNITERDDKGQFVPYKPVAVRPDHAIPDLTIRKYVAEMQKEHPDAQIKYRYAWEEVPRNTMMVSTIGGLILIGGIWPSIVGLITGAGIWGPRRKKEDYDLSRFGSGKEPAKQPAAEPSAADMSRLEEMEKELVANLDGFGAKTPTGAPAPAEETPAVRKLTTAPLDNKAAAVDPDEPKEYKGDFYPVARTGGKKEDEHKQ
jgi:hypothetical protein